MLVGHSFQYIPDNSIRDESFFDAITNIHDEMVLKIFINTIAKPSCKTVD